ncbi:MAG: NAD(P)-dependent alcohol dehydrogenase [Verrucomicrobiota bacterium]
MTTVHAFAATEANGSFKPFEYQLDEIGPDQVDIAVESCGICHSDLRMLENAWGIAQFPFVPGHEVIGKISAIGDQVTHLAVGDRVGLGWHSGYCMSCDQCVSGNHNLCTVGQGTIVGRHGGFADVVRAQAVSVGKIPDSLEAKSAGPLLCGGMAVFGPLVQHELSPTGSVGVIGIGGLGHLALKFANAWGCEVTAFTSSDAKAAEAKSLGAHHAINSRDPEAVSAAAGQFDLILSTVNVNLDWDAYVNALKPQGKLHMLGAVTEPVSVNILPMMFGQKSLSASPVGSPATIRKMLEFAARHQVTPVTEHFPMEQVNDAMDHLRSGKARYRIVLSNN